MAQNSWLTSITHYCIQHPGMQSTETKCETPWTRHPSCLDVFLMAEKQWCCSVLKVLWEKLHLNDLQSGRQVPTQSEKLPILKALRNTTAMGPSFYSLKAVISSPDSTTRLNYCMFFFKRFSLKIYCLWVNIFSFHQIFLQNNGEVLGHKSPCRSSPH